MHNMVRVFDKSLLKKSWNDFLLAGTLCGILELFCNGLIQNYWLWSLGLVLAVILLLYIARFVSAKKMRSVSLDIDGSTFIIAQKDIFEADGLKVINFDEFFDTKVDDKIIAKNSLNGVFLSKEVGDAHRLNSLIARALQDEPQEHVKERKIRPNVKYELGTIYRYDNTFLLTAFTMVDEDNRAYLSMRDYVRFLLNFWNNLDKVYANKCVNITLFGSSSLTRFEDVKNLSEQELVEIIIWTFKISRIKFKYPTTITLCLTEESLRRINLYRIKELYKNAV